MITATFPVVAKLKNLKTVVNVVKHVYGPIKSRRLGVSLGVDATPGRVCSIDCVYCEEAKPTVNLTLERSEYAPAEEIKNEVAELLATTKIEIDYITFSGSGEPTLNSTLGKIIGDLKKHGIPIAVLTNSTLLDRQDVREELKGADLVVPSLDAVSEEAFKKVNRPCKELSAAKVIAGLKTFCAEYNGEIWLEVLLVEGINDSNEEVEAIAAVANSLPIGKVQLNTISRATTVSGVRPVPLKRLKLLSKVFTVPVEIYN